MRRDKGFSLVEILVALALSSLVSAGVLLLVRGQLRAYDLNDAIVKAQQNSRAGIEFVETQLRRACGGISGGTMAMNIPGHTPAQTSCLKLYDSAVLSSGIFSTSGSTKPDAIEIVYATANSATPYAAATVVTNAAGSTTPQVTVNDLAGFSVGDLVLLTNFQFANLYKVVTINGGTTSTSGPGPLGFGTLSAAAVNATGYTPSNGDAVIKAVSYGLYHIAGTAPEPGMLYLDPDGMTGTYASPQPLIDGVRDFQLAVGIDWSTVAPGNGTQNDGLITEAASPGLNDDEWIGNHSSEVMPATPWNPSPAAAPLLLQIRSTIVVQTTNTYAEPTNDVAAVEDGATIIAKDSKNRYPRFRTMRSIVAPRAWNLGE